MAEDTIFHKIIRKEIPAKIEYEDDLMIAINDINPVAPVHILIIPKKTIPTPADITTEDAQLIGRMFAVARNIADKMALSENGFRLVMNCKEFGGQTVSQLHLHLIGGREFSWPPG